MDGDQCVARDFLGLAGNAGGADTKRRTANNNHHSSRGVGGEGESGMHGSGRGGVVRPSPVSYQDAGEASAARLRQMGEPTGLNLTSAFCTNNGRAGYRGQAAPVFNGSAPQGPGGVNSNLKGSLSPVPPNMPDYHPGQWAALEKVQNLAHLAQAQAQAQAQGHTNFAFDRSSSKELKGNYVSREDIAHGNYDMQQFALAASQAQFAANGRRFAAPLPNHNSARPTDDRNTLARPAERPGMMHDSSLSLSIGGPREHPAPVNSFRVPPVSSAMGCSNGAPHAGSYVAMAAPRSPPVHITGNGVVLNGLMRPATSNSPGRPPTAQLTIFYGGSVNVYDDVPFDKAQAIMLLAGTGSSFTTTIIHTPLPQSSPNSSSMAGSQLSSRPEMQVSSASGPVVQQQVAPPKLHVNATPSLSGPQQPPASGSCGASQSTGLPSAGNQHEAAPPTGASPNLAKHRGQRTLTELPQARKASLARFLEKRRERAVVRQKSVYSDKREGSPQQTKSSSPPRSAAGSPQRPQDGSNSPAAISQGEESQPNKEPMQVDEPEQGEECETWSKAGAEQKRTTREGSSSPIKAIPQ